MQHHRRKEPARARVSPFLAVVGVMAVTTGVVAGTPNHTLRTGEGLGAADSIRLPPTNSTTTAGPTTTAPTTTTIPTSTFGGSAPATPDTGAPETTTSPTTADPPTTENRS